MMNDVYANVCNSTDAGKTQMLGAVDFFEVTLDWIKCLFNVPANH